MNQFIRFIRASFARTAPALSSATARSPTLQLIIATFATLIALLLPQQVSAGYTVDTNSMNMTEMWWNPDESGWGASVIHRGNIMFIAVYTYNTSGLPKWYVVSRCEVSGSGCVGDLYDVTGGVPLTSVWNGSGIAGRVVGTFTMTFTDANHGVMEGKIDGVSWMKTISRELFGSVPCIPPQVANDTGNACVDPAPASACPAPSLPNVAGNACIYPVGAQKAVPATELPTSITTVTDPAFLAATITGEVLLIDTGAKATNAVVVTDRTRDIVFAVYRWNGYYVEKPLFKDTLRSVAGYNGMIESALAGSQLVDRFQGSADGMLVRVQPGNVCYSVVWDTLSIGFAPVLSSACPAWN